MSPLGEESLITTGGLLLLCAVAAILMRQRLSLHLFHLRAKVDPMTGQQPDSIWPSYSSWKGMVTELASEAYPSSSAQPALWSRKSVSHRVLVRTRALTRASTSTRADSKVPVPPKRTRKQRSRVQNSSELVSTIEADGKQAGTSASTDGAQRGQEKRVRHKARRARKHGGTGEVKADELVGASPATIAHTCKSEHENRKLLGTHWLPSEETDRVSTTHMAAGAPQSDSVSFPNTHVKTPRTPESFWSTRGRLMRSNRL